MTGDNIGGARTCDVEHCKNNYTPVLTPDGELRCTGHTPEPERDLPEIDAEIGNKEEGHWGGVTIRDEENPGAWIWADTTTSVTT